MGKVLILGASSDVGKSIAEEYSKLGEDLILAGRDQKLIEKIGKDLEIRFSNSVECYKLDITDFSSHPSFIDHLKILPEITICLIGYLGDQEKGFKEWGEAEQIIHRNYTGIVSILNVISARYISQKKGVIGVFSSVAGERGRQSNFLYGSAKAGLTAYLSGLRNSTYKHGVHVLTVKPGFIDTKMTEGLELPKALTASPAQVAKSTIKAISRKKDVLYVFSIWKYIMLIIRNIPERIFKKLSL